MGRECFGGSGGTIAILYVTLPVTMKQVNDAASLVFITMLPCFVHKLFTILAHVQCRIWPKCYICL